MKKDLRSGAILTGAWCAIALAFPWSNAFMSIATGGLALAVLWVFFRSQNKVDSGQLHFWTAVSGWSLVALVVHSAASAVWSISPELALNDARVKLPLLVGGIAVLASHKTGGVSPRSLRLVIQCAVVSSSLATLTLIGLDVLDGAPFGGRASSRFISHIRFGLWWAVLLPWIAATLPRMWLWIGIAASLATWTWTESLTGLMAGYVAAAWWAPALWQKRNETGLANPWPGALQLVRRLFGLGLLALALAVGFWKAMPTAFPDPVTLMEFSQGGERYVHSENRRVTENGHFVWTNIAWGELADAWRRRHSAPFGEVKGRLIRFLTSKGLMKDREGVMALSSAEVDAIASGVPSVVEWKGVGWARRWNRIRFNWGNGIDGITKQDDSILARNTYQKAAWMAISDLSWTALIFGKGTGSQQALMSLTYADHFEDWPVSARKHPHNQFLSLVLGMGLLGLLTWCLTLGMGQGSVHAWPGLLLLFLSCLAEDTLETQAGVTLALWTLAFPAFTRAAWQAKGSPLPD